MKRPGRRRPKLPSGVVPSRLAMIDLISEASLSIGYRPGRAALTALGTVLGVGAFVATAGLTSTARAQISGRFDVLRATEVVVKDRTPDPAQEQVLPDDAEDRLTRLNGVLQAGIAWTTSGVASIVTAHPFVDGDASTTIPVIAASPGIFAAAHALYESGSGFGAFHRDRGERVAVLGEAAARQLGLTRIDSMQAVYLDGVPYLVLGILGDVEREPALLGAVIVPDVTVTQLYGRDTGRDQAHVLIDVQPGAAQLIGSQAALALAPQNPTRLEVLVPPEPRTLRRNVEGDSTALFYVLATVSLAVGAVGIANTTLVAVLERRYEIGLRRSMGATKAHIAAQFLGESAALGAVGGLVGTVLGLSATVGVALIKEWQPTMPTTVLLAAPVLGAFTGLAAGIYPARRAAKTRPIDALRTG